MIPRTYPSTYAVNGQQQMVGFYLGSVDGLTRWVDYIPVRLGQTAPGSENTYDQDGYIPVASLSSVAGLTPFKDYVPLYIDNTATDVWTTNIAGYIPTGISGFGGASLGLDFTTSSTLDPRITFTRASNATVTNSAGVIAYAPHNLLTFSEQFDNAAWIRGNSTVTANTTTAPDGTLTADKLVEDTANSAHNIRRDGTSVTQGFVYTFSIYAKAGERSAIGITFSSTNFGANGGRFDLAAGTAVSLSGSPTLSIEPVGNGWFRCIYALTALATTSSNFTPQVFMYSGVASVYTGDGTSGIFIWGAQLNVGSLQPYYPTTVKNLLGYTQEFDNAAWTKSGASISATKVTAPDGSVTGQKLVENTATGQHLVVQSFAVTAGAPYTFSVYVKAAERTRIILVASTAGFASNQAIFNASNGTSTGVVGCVASITSVGGGWYRCSWKATATASASATFNVFLDNGSTPTYTGNGTSGIYIWGAQLSDSASLDPYVYNPGAAPSAAAYYGPRFDYDPVTLAPKGLLIEEQRTNLLLQSEELNNAAWTTVTNMSVGVNYTVAPDGALTADQIIENTSAGEHGLQAPNVSYTSGTSYTFSCYAKVAGRTILRLLLPSAAFSQDKLVYFDLSSGTVTSTSGTGITTSVTNVGNGWYRVSMSAQATVTATSTAAQLRLVSTGTTANYQGNGYSGIYIWGAQLEAGAFPTSYIPTTSAQVTRSADAATMTGTNFSSWYNAGEGTLYAEHQKFGTATFQRVVGVSDGGFDNRIAIGYGSGSPNNLLSIASVNAVTQAQLTLASPSAIDTNYKVALAYAVNDFASVVNAGTVQTDTSGTIPVVNRLNIGVGDNSGTNFLNGHISRIAYYPRRLSNAQLQALTS